MWCAAPDLGGDAVPDEFPVEVEAEKGVDGGVEKGLKNGALVDGIKRFLEVNFEDGDWGIPLQVNLYCTLDRIEGLSRLSLTTIAALGFRDLNINGMCTLTENPFGENLLELGHEADGSVFCKLSSSGLFG